MKDELRFVFDTNVLISAALFKTSVPRQALDLARKIGRLTISIARTSIASTSRKSTLSAL